MIYELAPAKINLTLEIIKKRDDGYHEIRTIMQTIDICDILTFWENNWLKIIPEYKNLPSYDSLHDHDNYNYLNNNLVYKAAMLLKKETNYKGGAIIQLNKNIPSSAGLGGGSSDAAAALRGLNKLWKLNLTDEELAAIGAEIGSDVPFFIYGGTCSAKGRGEIIEKLKPIPEKWIAIILLPINIAQKTKILYSFVTPLNYTTGSLTKVMSEIINNGYGSHDLKDIIDKNNNKIENYIYNIFEKIYLSKYANFKKWIGYLQNIVNGKVHLAGSGPAVYYISDSETEVKNMISKIEKYMKFKKYIARTVP